MKISDYPQCLIRSLAEFDCKPTGDIEWDRAVLLAMQKRRRDAADELRRLSPTVTKIQQQCEQQRQQFPDLSIPAVYEAHCKLFVTIANEIVLAPQRRRFDIDDNNRDILRFLLYYFNECPLAEEVFPGRGYKLHKNIMLQGGVGVGKTMIMQIFSEYLRLTANPRFFYNVSVTQMVNHFSIHNNIDLYTYNEDGSTGFQIKPLHLCLNDIGMENRPFYGIDTTTVVNDFLHARNELWGNDAIADRRFAHLTTNLDNNRLKAVFGAKDAYGRTVDRFKTYNVIPMSGKSRR